MEQLQQYAKQLQEFLITITTSMDMLDKDTKTLYAQTKKELKATREAIRYEYMKGI